MGDNGSPKGSLHRKMMKIVTLVVMLMNRDLTDFVSTYWSLVPENHDLCLWVLGSTHDHDESVDFSRIGKI